MDRDVESTAFARACTYLNYKASAKWTAYVSAVLVAFLLIGLLIVLGLFADVVINRGHLPSFRDLPVSEQQDLLKVWGELPTQPKERETALRERSQWLENLRLDPTRLQELVELGASDLWNPKHDGDRALIGSVLWKTKIHHILTHDVSEAASRSVAGREDEPEHGILGLAVRSANQGRFYSSLVCWLARWNPWMWDSRSSFALYSPYLAGLFLVALVLVVLRAGLTLLMYEAAARASIEAATRLRRAVYHHTFRLGTLAFRALGPSEAVTIFTRHVEAVHDALFLKLTTLFRDPIQFALLLLFAFLADPLLAFAILLLAVIVLMVGSQVVAYFRRRARQANNEASERLTLIRESLMLMRLVKCCMMEQFNQSRVERQLSAYEATQATRHRGDFFPRPVLMLLGSVAVFALLYLAGVIILQSKLGVAAVIAMVTALLSLYWPLARWLESRKHLRRGREAALHLFKFLDRPSEVGQVVGAEFLPAIEKQIEFDNVSLREPGSGRMLLQNLTLTIKSGQRVAIVGPDDLEKYALIYLIPRLLDPTSGEIRIDDHNLRWVTLDSLRDKISIVLMHNLVFHDTVSNNIGCGDPSYTLPKIIEAAKVARAHQFIQKLPKGYETPIGEMGHQLTLSQKYRIALARAILRDPALLILEEPEEGFDEETKELVDDTLARFLPGRTVIFLPHRVSTIRSCDRLFLLHNGRLEAAGGHKELLSQSKLYRHLHYLEFSEMADVV